MLISFSPSLELKIKVKEIEMFFCNINFINLLADSAEMSCKGITSGSLLLDKLNKLNELFPV